LKRQPAFDRLEPRLSQSAISPAKVDDLPPPGPEADPGKTPSDKEPIIYPTLPESGPAGPGKAH